MPNLIVQSGVTVDGFFAGPNDEIDWARVDEEFHLHMNEVLGRMRMFIHGRRTYELMAAFWPTADADPTSSPAVVEFASIWRDTPKIVYSRTLQRADWNTTIVREVDPDDVRALKERVDGDVVVGGAELSKAFLRHDLIDEFRVYVHPVLLGQGRPLFEAGGPRLDLELVETRSFGNGVVLLRYGRDRS
jgi:dihydrofolate reductase